MPHRRLGTGGIHPWQTQDATGARGVLEVRVLRVRRLIRSSAWSGFQQALEAFHQDALRLRSDIR
jgi:hypothetical protein